MDPNMQNMMSSYLKIKKLVEDESEEDEENEDDDTVERERAVKVKFVESQLKRKKLSFAGEEGSGRKTPAGGGGVAAAPCCLVESCQADLRGCKKYHQRHRVCEVHAKDPVVLVDGFRQRFCQQCSRFHEVSEFDQTKRSCRRRLAGHNERRRKSSLLDSQKDGTRRRRLKENQLRHLSQGSPGHQDFEIHS